MTSPRSSPRICPSVSGRESNQAVRSLEGSVGQRLDSSGDRVGVQATLGGPSGPSQGFPSHFQAACFTGSLSGVRAGDFSFGFEGSCRRNLVSGGVPRLLRPPVLRAEEVRGLPPSFGFVPTECVPQEGTFSYGDSRLDQSSHSSGGLGDLDRPQGCIFSCFDPPSLQEVAEIRLEGQNFPIQSPSLRSQPGPVGLYPYHAGNLRRSAFSGYQVARLPGRLADSGYQPNAQQQPLCGSGQHSTGIRLHAESGEVCPHTFPVVHLPRHGFQHGFNAGEPDPRENRPVHFSSGQVALSQSLNRSVDSCSFGPNGITSSAGPSWSGTQERASAAVPGQMVPGKAVLGHHRPSPWVASEGHPAVDGRFVAPSGGPYLLSGPSGGVIHRCIPDRLGSSRSRSHSLGPLVSGLADRAYQFSGDARCLSSNQGICPLSEGQSRVAFHRQHNCSLLCQQGGGVSLCNPLSGGRVPPHPLPGFGHCSKGKTCGRQTKHPGRLSEPSRYDTTDRMDSSPQCPSTSVVSVAQATDRPLCNTIQQETTDVCVSSARPGCSGDGCSFHELGRLNSICVPSNSDPEQGDQEGQDRRSLLDSDRSVVAGSAVVPRAVGANKAASTQTERRTKRAGSAKIWHSAPKPGHAVPSRLAGVRKRMRTLGASRQLCDLVSSAHRSGTNAVYSSHWKRWLDFCNSKGILPSKPSEIELANFLAYLFHDCKLSASSVRVYRAAICTTLRQLGSESFPNSPLLRDLIRGVSIKEARTPKRLPAWDLFLVLASLREAPYEPLFSADLKSLTCKTVFLIALASGRRASEVCSLSGLGPDIATQRDGTYILKFLPEFLAKNQNPSDPSPSISIRPLSHFLCPDDPDLKLCPVRALRRYLKFTRSLRHINQRKLFISFNPFHGKDISTASISRWLKLSIKNAYASSSERCSSSRAHEVRAWAASSAFAHSSSLKDVLAAAYWRSDTPFINFYLRDVSLSRGDGTQGISFVAAQQVVLSRGRRL